jgi:hypothetical protein
VPACPAGHDSQTSDYCDVCGAPMARVEVPAGAATGADAAQSCPDCGFERSGRFCEGCGYDFVAGHGPAVSLRGASSEHASSALAESEIASPPAASGAGETGDASPRSLMAIVHADRDYFDVVVAEAGPDAASLTFPPYCPERTFPLTGEQVRIGRHSASRGLAVEIDLTGPPLDPAVSHLHALLIRQPDGSWQVMDPGSANGTRINDGTDPIAVDVPVPVGAGDRIHIGAWTTITLHDWDGQ